jgi:hypothetical protein
MRMRRGFGEAGGRALLTTALAKGFALPLQEVQEQLITAQLADVPSEDKVWRACRSVKVGVLLANFQMEIRQNLETNAAFSPRQPCQFFESTCSDAG